MVAVRSAHINKAGEFDPEKWIASLGITSQKSCECLAETWAYCLQQTQGHPDASLLLWRGVEMVEILSTLSMDIDTLRAALLFPLADANVVSEDVLRESVGKSVVNLIHGVRDMAAIRQRKRRTLILFPPNRSITFAGCYWRWSMIFAAWSSNWRSVLLTCAK